METNEDLRVIRTRKLIKSAFLELMQTVGFERITVQSLSQKAMINRSTFYLHYSDKYDLLDSLEDEMLQGLKGIIMELPVDIIATQGLDAEQSMAVFLRVLEYIQQEREFFLLITGESGSPTFMQKMGETIKSVMREKRMTERLSVPERYMTALITGVQTSVINEWLCSGMKESPEEVALIVTGLMREVPRNLFAAANSQPRTGSLQ